MIEEARANPGKYVYFVDPEFNPDGAVPGWGIRGGYPVSDRGVLNVEGWVPNPNYRPSPQTLGWACPRTPVERALQLVAAHYQPKNVLLDALAQAKVAIATTPESPDSVPVMDDGTGRPTIYMFTDEQCLHPDTPRVTVAVAELLPMLESVRVAINPGQVPSVRFKGTVLADAITRQHSAGGFPAAPASQPNDPAAATNPPADDSQPPVQPEPPTSPRTSGFPEPTNRIERALELAVTGHGSLEDLVAALVAPDATLITVTARDMPGAVPVVPTEGGGSAIFAYTSASRIPQGTPSNPPVSVRVLADMLNDSDLILNPNSPPSAKLRGSAIISAIKESNMEADSFESDEEHSEQKWPTPSITDELRAHAAETPGNWVPVVDRDFQGDREELPMWAVQGAFPVESDGRINEAGYLENPTYRPGPRRSGFPEPTNHLERVLELAATDYVPVNDLYNAVTEPGTALITLRHRDIETRVDGEVTINTPFHRTGYGEQVAVCFTSPQRVPEWTPVNPALPVSVLGLMLRESDLVLNAGSPEKIALTGKAIIKALDQKNSGLNPSSKTLASALSKLPSYDGVVVRGLQVTPKDLEAVLSQYEPGTVVNERAFVDTTPNIPRNANILYVIYGGGGRDTGVDDNGERLIVFPAMSRFTVIRRVFDADTKTWVIVLKSEGNAR
ncbi:MAG TPA: type VII secretion system-associated protein [Pseudonocardiaceae bacterium]